MSNDIKNDVILTYIYYAFNFNMLMVSTIDLKSTYYV